MLKPIRITVKGRTGLKKLALGVAVALAVTTCPLPTFVRAAAPSPDSAGAAAEAGSDKPTAGPTQEAADLPVLALSALTEATRVGQKKAVYDSIKAGDPVVLQVEFFNGSKQDLNRVSVHLPKDDNELPFAPIPGAEKENVSFNIGAGAKALISLNLVAVKDLTAGTYNLNLCLEAQGFKATSLPVAVTVRSKDVQTAGTTGDQPSANLPGNPEPPEQDLPAGAGLPDFSTVGAGDLSGGWSGGGGEPAGGGNGSDAVKNKPKLIISNYVLDPEMAEAGQEFKLDLTFSNTNTKKEVRNIKITVNGEPAPASGADTSRTDTAARGANLQTGTVFSPVGSSNTFFIDSIPAKGESKKSITLKVLPNAAAQNYVMNILFEYEDAEGNEFRATEMIGIPVVQQAKMEAGEISIDPLSAGQPGSLNLDFFNTGKDSLTTFMVTLEGKGFTAENARYFLGNFAPGQSDHFTTMLTADQPGPLKGEVVFTFEDSAGKKHRETVPFETVVEEGKPDSTMESEENEKAAGPGSAVLPISIVVLILVAGLVTFLVLRRRKKQKSKKDLVIHD